MNYRIPGDHEPADARYELRFRASQLSRDTADRQRPNCSPGCRRAGFKQKRFESSAAGRVHTFPDRPETRAFRAALESREPDPPSNIAGGHRATGIDPQETSRLDRR